MKNQFLDYLGTENDLTNYQRSYKLVLYKYLFELMDEQGRAPCYDVSIAFKNFYTERIRNGKVPDVNVDQRIMNADNSSIRQIYAVIKEEPFKAINRQGYLSREKQEDIPNGKEFFILAPELIAELTPRDVVKIKYIVEKKLALYFNRIDGVPEVDIQSLLLKVLGGYTEAKQKPFSGNPMAATLRNNFPREIYKIEFVPRSDYVVTGSPGQGNWASVPWIGVFNKAVTRSATKGVYIAYLFASDCNSVYLTFMQGCSELKNRFGKSKALESMRQAAERIHASIDSRAFEKGDKIDLKDSRGLPFLYERGTIFFKEYKKDQIPDNFVLMGDLKKMVDIYNDYISIFSTNDYFPTLEEYNPNIDSDTWLNVLKDSSIISDKGYYVLKCFLDVGGESTCAMLRDIYGLSDTFYANVVSNISECVAEKLDRPLCNMENAKAWPIMFLGHHVIEDGKKRYSWRLRDELKEALGEFDFSTVEVYRHAGGEEDMTVKEKIERVKAYIKAKGFTYANNLIENFYLSIKSKPFVILAGISGTGKTKLVKLFSEAIDAEYLLVPVRPDWSDSSDLFGHLDLNGRFIEGAITRFVKDAMLHPHRPYILCFDEMNLARVEYYFSDFLSVIETRCYEKSEIISEPLVNINIYGSSSARELFGELRFPENLYIVGTVNMDETTFQFSRKVLDRANTIEFSYVDLIPEVFSVDNVEPLLGIGNDFVKNEYLQLSQCEDQEFVTDVCTELHEINKVLQKANAHVGYRVRDEIAFYMLNNRKTNLLSKNDAFDNEIMQKILPRIQGSNVAIKNILIELFQKCAGDYTGLSGSNTYEQMDNYIQNNSCIYQKSACKIAFMVRRFEEDGFTSYWL